MVKAVGFHGESHFHNPKEESLKDSLGEGKNCRFHFSYIRRRIKIVVS